jgi:hypothetical protein
MPKPYIAVRCMPVIVRHDGKPFYRTVVRFHTQSQYPSRVYTNVTTSSLIRLQELVWDLALRHARTGNINVLPITNGHHGWSAHIYSRGRER